MSPARGRRGRDTQVRRYPRSARVNEILREVLAEELRELADLDERLGLTTVTSVDCDPDLRHATVYLSSLDERSTAALADLRVRLQAAISRQVRLKHTPQLSFEADPAIRSGQHIEDILHSLGSGSPAPAPGAGGGVEPLEPPASGAKSPGPGDG